MPILIIEDDDGLADLITETVKLSGHASSRVGTAKEAMDWLSRNTPDVVLLDYSLPDMNAVDFISELEKQNVTLPPFIISTGQGDERIAVTMMKLGAKDYIVKDNHFLEMLPEVLRRVIRELKNENKLKLTEEALLESEEIFRQFMDNSPIHVFFKDEQLRTVRLSANFEKMVGKPMKEMIGRRMDELFPSGFAEKITADDKKVLKEGKPVSIEEELDGRYYTTTKFPIHIQDKHRFLAGYSIDITERKLAEEALHKREAYLSAIIQNQPGLVWLKDSDGRFLAVNRAFVESFNCKTAEEIIGKTDLDLWPLELAKKYREDDLKIMGSGKSVILEEPIAVNGNARWFETFKTPVFDEAGNIIGTTGYARDITEKRLADLQKNEMLDALASEKERLAVTLRSIGDGVITTDTTGKIVIMNSIAEKLTGWSQSEAFGKPLASVFRIINDQTRTVHENPVENVLSHGNSLEFSNHTLLVARDGTERSISDSSAPIKNLSGEIIGVVLVFRDMTEKLKAQENMLRAQKLESVGILAGGIAHDFNNLLSIIYGNLELMSLSSNKEEIADYLDSCLKTMKRAKGITMQLLTFSKGGAPIKKTGNILPFIQETVKFALSGSNSVPHFSLEKDLWTLEYDENQIGQVFDNIVINATQAMPGGGNIEVSASNITLKPEEHPSLLAGNYIRISFKDGGIGIPQEIISRIFDPYFSTKQTGRGLGLASAYSIIKRHEGCIDVESVAGKGTIFHIFLPASKKPPLEKTLFEKPTLKGTGRILIMDDEADLRKILQRTIQSLGYTSVGAADGNEVLKILTSPEQKQDPFTGIILDLTIPGGMGGQETVKEIRKFAPDLPVFVYSGYSDDPVMTDPGKYGFTGSLAKPFRPDELAEMLRSRK